MIGELKQKFITVFEQESEGVYFAPGRVNLIGEHTDYNGGNVFPCAITIGTYGLVRKREDKKLRFYSENFQDLGVIECDVDNLKYIEEDEWTNYPKGMIFYLQEAGYLIDSGMDLYFYGNIPNGAGLSSSASIELLTGIIVEDVFNLKLERLTLILMGKKVENDFIGVNSGIMDQFAIGMGSKNQAILLDCNTLEYELVPMNIEEYVIVIMNTNKRRELADSKYNIRRSECEKALALLQQELPINSLGEIDERTFLNKKSLIEDVNLMKRARHAITENQRTLYAKDALSAGDLVKFGKLMNESHESLKNDYEVTGIELDTLVEVAQKQEGVLGARMTGAGFGGCAIALVKNDCFMSFKEKVNQVYTEKIGYSADFYKVKVSDGAKKLEGE